MLCPFDMVRLQPTPIEYSLFYTHPSAAERVLTAMQWRAARARPAPP
jgi:Zn-dependent protease with chaperone function